MGEEDTKLIGLSDELRAGVPPTWGKVVSHSFVTELGDNTLSREIFYLYFDQDYLFLKDWSVLLNLAAAKAPDFDAARHIVAFLHLGLAGEEGLFQRAFRERGLSPKQVVDLEHRPTTLHYSGYLRQIAYEGSFIHLVATLLAVEWPYMDWAQRLEAAGKHPDNYYYQTWIEIHPSQGMVDFVAWLRQMVDSVTVTASDRSRMHDISRNVLRYELMFWEMAYQGEAWPK